MNDYYLREAEEKDVDLLYKWTCDSEVRKNSLNTNQIQYDDHKAWFSNVLSANISEIFIYYCDSEPIGQLRIDIDGNKANISYSIEKQYRGKGHGKKILELLEYKLRLEYSFIKELTAVVKNHNIASMKKFEELKYSKTEEQDVVRYYKEIKLKPLE